MQRITQRSLNRLFASRGYAKAARTYPAVDDVDPNVVVKAPFESYDPEVDPQLAGLNYPKLPLTSRQLRSPTAKWWDPQERANFGEVLAENDDIQAMTGPDVYAIKPSSAVFQFLLALGTVGSFATFLYYFAVPAKQYLPRAYPHNGLENSLPKLEYAKARSLDQNE